MRSVCVYCGSNAGLRADYARAARAMGQTIATRGLTMVFGGGQVGLMGIAADAALAAGGEVIGVIPEFLAIKEVAHEGLTDMRVVSSMHDRKAVMADISDGFLALPGGVGTLEELFEIWTWGQLGRHAKPVGVLNAAGYFDGLLDFLDRVRGDGFVSADHRAMLIAREDPGALLDAMGSYVAPPADIRLKVGQE